MCFTSCKVLDIVQIQGSEVLDIVHNQVIKVLDIVHEVAML